MTRLASDRLALLIIAAFALLSMWTSSAIPPFEAADEMPHFLNVHLILETGALPLIPTRDDLRQADARGDSVMQWAIETHQPPAYYVLGAALTFWSQRDDLDDYLRPNTLIFTRGVSLDNANKWLHNPTPPAGDTHRALWTLRLYSLSLACFTLWLIYRGALLVFERAAVALTALALVASMHTFASIGASVNNDNLVTLLYTLGVYWTLHVWRHGLTRREVICISALLPAIALTKITGAGLFAIVYGALIYGVWRRRWSWRDAARVILISGVAAVVLAGWWYARNWSLYGDPLALDATQALWGRTFANAQESPGGFAEAWRVWRSFWFMTGHLHQPVYGPLWLNVYALIAVVLAFIGAIFAARRAPRVDRDLLLILGVAAVLPIVLLVTGTRSVDISYGRLLFPALIGVAPLLAWGWRGVLGRFAPVLILPFTVAAVLAPLVILPDAYPTPTPLEALPASAIPIGARVESLEIVAYARHTDTLPPDGEACFTLYLRGTHPDNPALVVTLIDPVTLDARGSVTVYPAMMPTDSLMPDALYAVPLRVRLTPNDSATPPRLLRVTFGWQVITETDYLPLTLADGTAAEVLTLDAATLLDPRYTVEAPAHTMQASFGGVIALDGVTLDAESLRAGESLNVAFVWRDLAPMPDDAVLTVQLLDEAGGFVAQSDGDVAGYPTTAWRGGTRFRDARTLTIPSGTAAGVYRVWVGWYRLADVTRLTAQGAGALNDLVPLPVMVTVTE